MFLIKLFVAIGLVIAGAGLYLFGAYRGRLREAKGNNQLNLSVYLKWYEVTQSGNFEKLTNDLRFLIYANVDWHDRVYGMATNDNLGPGRWEALRAIYNQEKTQVVTISPESLTKTFNDQIGKTKSVVTNK